MPATCYLDLRKGQIVASEIRCDGGGALEVGGWTGPWHNDVYAVALGVGVSGTLTYETRAGESAAITVPLTTGVVYLDETAARFGVHQIQVTFSATDQHFHLFRDPDRGGGEALLVYVLDVP